jgi:hypothetical protein
MAIASVQWNWFSGSGNGYRTIDVDIPPGHGDCTGGALWHQRRGTQYTGIKHYRKRLPTGADQDTGPAPE